MLRHDNGLDDAIEAARSDADGAVLWTMRRQTFAAILRKIPSMSRPMPVLCVCHIAKGDLEEGRSSSLERRPAEMRKSAPL